MMKKASGHKMDTVFVLIIFCVFALSVLFVLMLGVSIYKNVTGLTQDGNDEQIALSYIWSKVKNDDRNGTLSVGDFYGYSSLFFDEEYDGVEYRTMIYYYDGWIRELTSEKDLEFEPVDGTEIMRIGDLSFSEQGHGIIKVASGELSLMISPRSGTAWVLPGSVSDEGGAVG